MNLTITVPDTATLRDKILAVFRAYNRPMTAKEVTTILGDKPASVACAVNRAVADGLLSECSQVTIPSFVNAYAATGNHAEYTL